MIQALAAKWYGSNAEMFEFARSVSLRAPEGHGLHALIASAHLEQWLDLTHESPDGRERQIRYFSNPAVQVEIRAAAAKSIGSSRYARTLRTPDDRNLFAMCYWLMKDYQAQLEQMDLIGSLITASPWQYQGDPGWAYQRARTTALQQVATELAAGEPTSGPQAQS